MFHTVRDYKPSPAGRAGRDAARGPSEADVRGDELARQVAEAPWSVLPPVVKKTQQIPDPLKF